MLIKSQDTVKLSQVNTDSDVISRCEMSQQIKMECLSLQMSVDALKRHEIGGLSNEALCAHSRYLAWKLLSAEVTFLLRLSALCPKTVGLVGCCRRMKGLWQQDKSTVPSTSAHALSQDQQHRPKVSPLGITGSCRKQPLCGTGSFHVGC